MMIVKMIKKYVGNRNALNLVMFQKRKMFVTKINIVILTMEYATNFVKILENVQMAILATIPSVQKAVLVLMIVARINIVMSND